jgi:hypothetical protein
MHTVMARSDFVYIALHKGLGKQIDKTIQSVFVFDKPKYESRTDFVEKWVMTGLTKEKKEVVAE